jgi:hypothetical protein
MRLEGLKVKWSNSGSWGRVQFKREVFPIHEFILEGRFGQTPENKAFFRRQQASGRSAFKDQTSILGDKLKFSRGSVKGFLTLKSL